jgi:biopolymer transport protein ExbD
MKLYNHYLSPQRGGEQAEPGPMIEMNTTPLIDVMLVLIVMLIITIPMQLHSVNLDMPSSQVSPEVPEVVVLQMDAAGFLRWGAEAIPDIATLNARVSTAAAMPMQPEIHLRPSADTPYAYVAAFLAMAQKAGLTKVGVVN